MSRSSNEFLLANQSPETQDVTALSSISEAQKIEDKKIEDAKNYAKNYLNDDEKILIRRSGTEDKIRIMAESHDASKVKQCI